MASTTSKPAADGLPESQASRPPEDIARLSFEEAMKALEEIVQQLEAGRVDLETAVAAYERGVWLRKHCETRLADARAKVERIGVGADGTPSTAPLDVE
jgi:exodeoxyribonuclease VII small subunit